MSAYTVKNNNWIAPIRRTIPTEGLNYLGLYKVFNTPTHVNGCDRPIDDYQPFANIKHLFANNLLSTDKEIELFADKFSVDILQVIKYIDHLTAINIP